MRKVPVAIIAVSALSLFAKEPPPPGGGRGRGPGMAAPKNLKILTAEEVRPAMGAFVAGTGLKCMDCHVAGDFASDEKHARVVARKMLEMVRGINANTFSGDNKVTCYTCHRGEAHPLAAAPVGAAPAK